MTKKIAIQGYYGSYHEIAARHYFIKDKVEMVPCRTFQDVFNSVVSSETDRGVIAIENTLVGSILSNYTLLRKSNLKINGEHKLRIKHNLLALPGVKIEDIKEVHSHPMAIQQCDSFFDDHRNIRLVNGEDTAYMAHQIRQKLHYNRGAIASTVAAQYFNLDILAKNIETHHRNFTRFLVISKTNNVIQTSNQIKKTTIVVTLAHEAGSLANLLDSLAEYGINLTKIQSMPLVGAEWKYLFYIDLEYNDPQQLSEAIHCAAHSVFELQTIGEYFPADTTDEAIPLLNSDSTNYAFEF